MKEAKEKDERALARRCKVGGGEDCGGLDLELIPDRPSSDSEGSPTSHSQQTSGDRQLSSHHLPLHFRTTSQTLVQDPSWPRNDSGTSIDCQSTRCCAPVNPSHQSDVDLRNTTPNNLRFHTAPWPRPRSKRTWGLHRCRVLAHRTLSCPQLSPFQRRRSRLRSC
jgi:hypothetical protein